MIIDLLYITWSVLLISGSMLYENTPSENTPLTEHTAGLVLAKHFVKTFIYLWINGINYDLI